MSNTKTKKMKTSILICCPICNATKKIKIPDNFLEEEIGTLIPVEIERNQVCEHYFTAMVDLNLSVRDYIVPKQRKPLTEQEFEELMKKFSAEQKVN
jgi:hypothetical protein